MKLYIYSGTHWDREWYQTFQGFRFRLVKLLDTLLSRLETDDAYDVFHFKFTQLPVKLFQQRGETAGMIGVVDR